MRQPGETVTRALKRLGAQKAARPRPGKRPPTSGDAAQPQLSDEEQKHVQAQFDRLTEAASALMDSGDLDVYSQDKVPDTGWLAVHKASATSKQSIWHTLQDRISHFALASITTSKPTLQACISLQPCTLHSSSAYCGVPGSICQCGKARRGRHVRRLG